MIDTLPSGAVAFDSASGTGWTCGEAAGVVTCTRSGLAVGAAPVITINGTVDSGAVGTIINNYSVSSPTTDPISGNDSGSEDTTVIEPDQPPEVSSTAPANSDTGVEPDANIVITFSEPVTVTGDWFNLACAGSAPRTVTGGDFAITDGNPTFTPRDEWDHCRDFRNSCSDLLEEIYQFLARMTLSCHINDSVRIEEMEKLGFRLKPIVGGPLPEEREFLGIIALVAAVLTVPLTIITGRFHSSLIIGSIILISVVMPLIVAYRRPDFATTVSSSATKYAFPASCALLAFLIGALPTIWVSSVVREAENLMDVLPTAASWSAFQFVIAFAIAHRMQVGAYPDATTLSGWSRIRAFGDAADGLFVLIACCVVTMPIFVPALFEVLNSNSEVKLAIAWARVFLPPVVAFVVGFFVPTIYRLNVHRVQERETRPDKRDRRCQVNSARLKDRQKLQATAHRMGHFR